MDRGRNARGRPECAPGRGTGHQARRETALRGRDAGRRGRCRLGRSAQLDSMPMTAYRYRRIWFLLGWAMVVTVVVLSLIPLDVDLGNNRDKLAHFAAYGGLSFWFGMLIDGRGRELRVAAAFALLGVALEFLQGLTDYRTFEIADMIANATGAALGWGLAQTPLRNVLGWMERLIAAVSRGRGPGP
ncbi:MAG: VanZ family protein [Betaproteobacteria bacterium]|nr:MAG: VanZ family protein [Betaproteobacteria bacterium]